jgi:hypothetical protein
MEQDMNLSEVLSFYDEEQRHTIEYPDARREEAPPVVRGVRYPTIDASPMSRPIFEKHGFQTISTATE